MTTPDTQFVDGSDLTGRMLHGYQLLRRLGQGGMAFVYLARQESLRRFVALKVLKPALASDPNYVRRFHREAQAAAALVHPNIVQIIEIGDDAGLHFIALEYVPGQNVKQWMSQQSAFPVASALAILRQVNSALEKASEAGIVHRDIKPENILIADDGIVKVADFGLARVNSDRGLMELTHVGMTMGTPMYMSPEQIEGRELDSRSDVYSLGVTAYHMLAGRPPFEAENTISLAMKQLQGEPVALDRLRPDIPHQLAQLIQRMMMKDADRRPTPRELMSELESIPEPPDTSATLDPSDWAGRVAQSAGNLEATQRLAKALRTGGSPPDMTHHARWWSRWVWITVPILTGAVIALIWSHSDPLARFADQVDSQSARRDTIEKQFLLATLEDTEQAWNNVISYFPRIKGLSVKEQHYVRTARQRLARLYLEEGRNADAIPQLSALTQMPETERGARAFGFAGLAVAYARLENWDAATSAFTQYLPLRSALDAEPVGPFFRQVLAQVERDMRERLANETFE